MKKLKAGIVGLGWVAGEYVKGFLRNPQIEFAAVCSRRSLTAGDIESQFGAPAEVYNDYQAMLEKEQLDAVVIASPPWLHRDQLRDAIGAGVHILCEKPLATTLEDCSAMVEMAASHPKVVQAGHSKRFETGKSPARPSMSPIPNRFRTATNSMSSRTASSCRTWAAAALPPGPRWPRWPWTISWPVFEGSACRTASTRRFTRNRSALGIARTF